MYFDAFVDDFNTSNFFKKDFKNTIKDCLYGILMIILVIKRKRNVVLESHFPMLEKDFPTWETNFPTLETGFLTFKKDFRMLKKDFPTWETNFPTLEIDFPTWETDFPTLENDFPRLSFGKLIKENHKLIFQLK